MRSDDISTTPDLASMHPHPNAERWQRAVDTARLRGELVCDLLTQEIDLNGMNILDAGCGIGGTSAALHDRGCSVTAIDSDILRLKSPHLEQREIRTLRADLEAIPLEDGSQDIVVLQDVLEHVADPAGILMEAARVLRPGGSLYLSTPNRYSLLNLLADPHFGLPVVSMLKRRQLRTILRLLRPDDAQRPDIAQLLSLSHLGTLLADARISWNFTNRSVARIMLQEPEKVVWSDFHLGSIRFLRRTGAGRFLVSLVNDKTGLFNSILNPTWYIVGRKDHS